MQLAYDVRSAVDVELYPTCTHIRVLSWVCPEDVRLELDKLRSRKSGIVPGMLIAPDGRNVHHLASIAAGWMNAEAQPCTQNASTDQFQTEEPYSSNPPDFLIFGFEESAKVRLVDFNALRRRLMPEDLATLREPAFKFSGDSSPRSILDGIGLGRITLPSEACLATKPPAESALRAFRTSLLLPGAMLRLDVMPGSVLVCDNHRMMSALTCDTAYPMYYKCRLPKESV